VTIKCVERLAGLDVDQSDGVLRGFDGHTCGARRSEHLGSHIVLLDAGARVKTPDRDLRFRVIRGEPILASLLARKKRMC
jgi:hypothetical protein